ncbi:MAG: DUF421 domain-containing protein [Oscillospiraceae bacterium]|nr:DUF421 domain-containing protein [Oscillospiraceae bacterium]
MITAFVRTVILYLILMLVLRLLGKRQIGDLEPSELVLTLTISDLASVPMQNYGIPLLNGVLPIVTLLCLSMLVSFLSLKSIRFRALVCGKPAIIIRDGTIIQQSMAKNRLTLDELFEQLRTQGYSDLRAVKYAILETNGQLSILPYTKESPLTPQGAGLTLVDRVTLPIFIINDGHIMEQNLALSGHDKEWVYEQLKKNALTSPHEVFLMTADESGSVICIKKELST